MSHDREDLIQDIRAQIPGDVAGYDALCQQIAKMNAKALTALAESMRRIAQHATEREYARLHRRWIGVAPAKKESARGG